MRLDLERDVEVLRDRIHAERDTACLRLVKKSSISVSFPWGRHRRCWSPPIFKKKDNPLSAHKNIMWPGRPSVLFLRQLVQI